MFHRVRLERRVRPLLGFLFLIFFFALAHAFAASSFILFSSFGLRDTRS